MTNEQILQHAASMNFAHLYVDSSCHMPYGRVRWEQRLLELSCEQREKLVAKIQHWQSMRAREVRV
jgi:hypothetical protein